MTHRKREHNNSLGNCNQFAQNNCRFQESECWYKHEENENNFTEEGTENDVKKDDAKSVFQKASQNLEPPLQEEN